MKHDADEACNHSATTFICYCSVCSVNAIKSKETMYCYKNNDTHVVELRTTLPLTSINNSDRPIIESPLNVADETWDQIACECLSIEDQLQFKLLKLQALLDSSHVSIFNQDKLLKMLFTDIGDKNKISDQSLVSFCVQFQDHGMVSWTEMYSQIRFIRFWNSTIIWEWLSQSVINCVLEHPNFLMILFLCNPPSKMTIVLCALTINFKDSVRDVIPNAPCMENLEMTYYLFNIFRLPNNWSWCVGQEQFARSF